MIVIKKYSNRRLYDTEESRYITLEELATKIRKGSAVRVLDAGTNEDLTQATLAQIILESRGAARLLPVPLLMQLIRMGDDALAEFMGLYLSYALDLYLQARQGMQSAATMNPLTGMAASALGRFFGPPPGWGRWPEPAAGTTPGSAAPSSEPFSPAPPPPDSEVASLRRELDEIKAALRQQASEPAPQPATPRKRGRPRTRR